MTQFPLPGTLSQRQIAAMLSQAIAAHRAGNYAEAEQLYTSILASDGNHFDALHMLGTLNAQCERFEEAERLLRKALAIDPNFPPCIHNYGNALFKLHQNEEAIKYYDKALAIKPNFAPIHSDRGNALRELKRHEEALASHDRALAINPNLSFVHFNRANLLRQMKRFSEALTAYDKAIEIDPNFADAHSSRGRLLLLLGDFECGLREYEWRWQISQPTMQQRRSSKPSRSFRQPLWLGEADIAGKTLFIHWEQGLGDTIQFCRYAKLVEAQGAIVIMSVQQPLGELLKQISQTIQIVDPNETPPHFDYHSPLLSLPLALATRLETIPAERQYLKSSEELRTAWSARLPPKTKPRIGLVWRGGTGHKNDHNRSMELEQLLAFVSSDADWTCLQKEVSKKELAVLRQDGRIAFFGDDLKDFSDTAALLDMMDLIITVDTSVAHLAGALGKLVWILLPFDPDWRWLLDRQDSPWYPSAKLFRQQQTGDWAGVIDRVKNALRSVTR